MTSLMLKESSNAMKMKQKLMNDVALKEEPRSFLNISRENLSISHSDLEQGFNRSRSRLNRSTILSMTALTVALLCLSLTSWKLFDVKSCTCYSLSNARVIEEMKRDIDILKQRLSKQDLDKMKSFGKTLSNEDAIEDSDPDEEDIDNVDYDPNYDDDISATHDYSDDYRIPLIYGARPSDFTESTSTPVSQMSPSPGPKNPVAELIATLHEAQVKRRREFERNMRESHKSIERESLKQEHEGRLSHEERNDDASNAQRKRETVADADRGVRSNKSKRSVSDYATTEPHPSRNTPNYQHGERHHRRTIGSKGHSYASGRNEANDNSETDSFSTPHHSKKYNSHLPLEELIWNGASKEIIVPNARTNESERRANVERVNGRNAQLCCNTEVDVSRPIEVYAIHYEADSMLFTSEDEHTGNGRVRHSSGVFKAWRPASWVSELGMNRHFTLAADGQLTVHQAGLYMIYAQIHYIDEHDENGFHVLVNGRPIMQCMVYSPGVGHKSRSCYTSQIIYLQTGDRIILKDVGSARYSLFQRDKSFFGLATLAELRQQQRHN